MKRPSSARISAGNLVILAEHPGAARDLLPAPFASLVAAHRGRALSTLAPATSAVTPGAGVGEAMRALGQRDQRVDALVDGRRLADDMQAVRDQRVFEFEDRLAELATRPRASLVPGRLGLGEVDRRRLRLDDLGEFRASASASGSVAR